MIFLEEFDEVAPRPEWGSCKKLKLGVLSDLLNSQDKWFCCSLHNGHTISSSVPAGIPGRDRLFVVASDPGRGTLAKLSRLVVSLVLDQICRYGSDSY